MKTQFSNKKIDYVIAQSNLLCAGYGNTVRNIDEELFIHIFTVINHTEFQDIQVRYPDLRLSVKIFD